MAGKLRIKLERKIEAVSMAQSQGINQMKLLPDGNLISVGEDVIKIWDPVGFKEIRELKLETGALNTIIVLR